MPVRFAVPLPGPFYWTPRRRTHKPRPAHRTRFESPAYWLLGGWAFEATFWVTAFVVLGSCWLGWWLLRLSAAALLWSAGTAFEWVQTRRRPAGKHRTEGDRNA